MADRLNRSLGTDVVGFLAAMGSGNIWVGLAVGGLAGLLVSIVMVVFCVRLGLDQIIVGIALMISILLQARGTGLSSTFGGESTAYRSRRGIERTLFRLTVVLVAVFIIISLVGARTTSPTA